MEMPTDRGLHESRRYVQEGESAQLAPRPQQPPPLVRHHHLHALVHHLKAREGWDIKAAIHLIPDIQVCRGKQEYAPGTRHPVRNPTPKEIIAQLLLRRAHKATHNPPTPLAPPFVPPAPTSSPLIDPEVDQGGGGGGGGGGGFGGGGGRVEEEDVAALTNLIVDEACTGSGCGSADEFKERWSMPLMKLGNKRYYLGIFFKANWYKAWQYCRFHGMHLGGIETERENRFLEQHIQDRGLGHEHFWTSGTDQGEEGNFFWMSNGQPVTYTNWNAGEPNNFQYENGEMEHCLELWNRDGKGLKWNDSPCSFETYFICEVE